jgi:hypothetical protein
MAEATAEAAAAATTSQAARRRCRYHVILTGASGYLGQHLLHDFMQSLDDSYHIHALFGGNTHQALSRRSNNIIITATAVSSGSSSSSAYIRLLIL